MILQDKKRIRKTSEASVSLSQVSNHEIHKCVFALQKVLEIVTIHASTQAQLDFHLLWPSSSSSSTSRYADSMDSFHSLNCHPSLSAIPFSLYSRQHPVSG